jgi:hypothetical protein
MKKKDIGGSSTPRLSLREAALRKDDRLFFDEATAGLATFTPP